VHQERTLTRFIEFMEHRERAIITTKLALEWATQSPGKHASWAIHLSDVRGFARYLRNSEPRTEVPPTGLIPRSGQTQLYLYTGTEIQALLAAALALPPEHGLRRWTYQCLFRLLAVTGLRISEALGLKRVDADLDEGILTIRGTKFGKSRLVPIHPSTLQVLLNYAQRRDLHLALPLSPYFLVAEQGGKLQPQHVSRVFLKLSRQIGLCSEDAKTGPRLHDFRHSFAVASLLAGYRSEQSVDKLMPVLSTYLGHTCIRDTYWYLSACPELMGHTTRRLEKRWEAFP
jgi:integrase